MATLIHATLTEDEEVLVEAMAPAASERVCCVHARGNGDAALALLAAGARQAIAGDVIDPAGIEAQLALKTACIRAWPARTFRLFLGLDPGLGPDGRAQLWSSIESTLPDNARTYWLERRQIILAGMAQSDETSIFARRLARLAPTLRALDRHPRLLRLVLRVALLGLPLFIPPEERAHSLGVRQLRAEPLEPVRRLLATIAGARTGDPAGAASMNYLSASGLACIRDRLDGLALAPIEHSSTDCKAIYLSNVADYLPADRWATLVETLVGRASRPCRVFMNTTWSGDGPHPSMAPLVARGVLRFDHERSSALRRRDRVRVYPGLALLWADGAHACG